MIWRNVLARALVLVVVALAQCGLAFAQGSHVFLVSQDAASREAHEDEWGDGTAFAAIQPAVDAAQADASGLYLILVEIGPGAYAGPIEIDAGANIVLRGILDPLETPDRPTIAVFGSGSAVRINGSGSGVTIDTFRIVGGNPGIQITGADATEVAQPTITNCVITGGTDGVVCYEHSTPRIVNCMIVDNGDGGIVCYGDSEPWLMNDTISGNQTGIDLLAGGLAIEVTNTIAWGNSVADVPAGVTAALTVTYSDIGTVDFGPSNITDDPQFVGAGDYHLTNVSPCINLGTDANAPSTDYEGDARATVVDPDVDIGADEYFGGGPGEANAYAVPDPTSYQPRGGLLFFVTGTNVTNVRAQRGPATIPAFPVFDAGGGGSSVYANDTPIDETTGDGTWLIMVEADGSWQLAGTFVIDTTPPVVGPSGGANGPYNILAGHNDTISAASLNFYATTVLNWWGNQELPNPTISLVETVPNDGTNFFFNTGATHPNGAPAGTGAALTIDFEVEAIDPPGPGADAVAGFEGYWARSGRPIIRDRSPSSAGLYQDPVPLASGAASATWRLQFRPLTEGVYDIQIVAEDRAGNVTEEVVPLRVYWDKTPPTTNITSKPRSRESSTQAGFTWRRGGTRILPLKYSTCLQMMFGGWQPVVGFTPFFATEGTTYSGLYVGFTYRFTVLAIDDAGNIETTVDTDNQYEWTVGDPVRDTVITSGPPRVTTDTAAVFTFKEIPEDNLVRFQWRLLNSAASSWIDVQGGYQHTQRIPFPLGDPVRAVSYVFQVRAWKDYNGDYEEFPYPYPEQNEADPTPATYNWTVVPPARGDDPGAPVLPPGVPTEAQPTILEGYGIGQYVDAPGEQPVKYFREQAK